MELVLSLFPGVGLLDRAFAAAGFCIVQAQDKITGGDIRDFVGVPRLIRFDPDTQFITATHRLGERFSPAEIYRGLLKHEDFVDLGQSIAAFLNGHQP
jgi:hypothetical protein